MTRFSDLALALLLLAPSAGAEPLVADAFGLFDPETGGDRATWSGLISAGRVEPGPPDRIVIFAGPKSLVAGKDEGHVAAIILDRSGNLVADGTPATLAISGTRSEVRTDRGIAHRLIAPSPRAGDLLAGAMAGDRQSPKAVVSVVADVGSVQPRISGPLAVFPGETAIEITSAPLADRFGNRAPDGTAATLVLAHADGTFTLAFGQVLGDRLQAHLITRDIPGAAKATLTLGRHNSAPAPLTIAAPKPEGRPALVLDRLPAIAALRLTLGPFLTTDGYALSDGAEVSLTARLADGTSHTDSAFAKDGSISLILPLADPATVVSLDVRSPLGLIDLTADWHTAAAGGVAP